MATKVLFVTASGTFTVPADFDPTNNSAECLGAGGPGSVGVAPQSFSDGSGYSHSVWYTGPGGAGAAYAKKSNINILPGQTVTVTVGTNGGDTSFGTYCVAKGGSTAPGSQVAGCVGEVKYAGGSPTSTGESTIAGYTPPAGNGGGAAGPSGAGGTTGQGSAGTTSTAPTNGSAGPATWTSTAGPTAGPGGGGGGAGGDYLAGAGGDYVPTGNPVSPNGANGGNYGAGAGGAAYNGTPGTPGAGLIIVTYRVLVPANRVILIM